MTNFTDVVKSLVADNAQENISKIKAAVKDQIQANDSRVRVAVTDHFNHSFVPDLVLTWPEAQESRKVFLRTSFRDYGLARDIHTLADERPILIPLSSAPAEERQELKSTAREGKTLVAEIGSLKALEDASNSKPVVSLLSHAVLQGGEGVLTTEDATAASNQVDDGFEGAKVGDASRTSVAIESAASVLDSQRAAQINRLLHAVWVGSGAAGSAFPGAPGVTAQLDAESLRFILALPDFDNDEFWMRLGSGLTLARLCELVEFEDNDNLQRLLAGNAYRLEGKACRVIQSNVEADVPRWSVSKRNLVLAVEKDRIFYCPSKLEELPNPGEPVDVGVDDLQSRAQGAGLKIREVRLTDGTHTLSYSAEGDASVTDSDDLPALEELMADAELVSASIIGSKHDMSLQFNTRTASGYGPARFPISLLTSVAAPIFVSPAEDTMTTVMSLVVKPEPAETQDEAGDDAEPASEETPTEAEPSS